MKQLFLILLLSLSACNYPQYRDDLLLGSASAQSPEAPMWVHGKACTDIDGKIGFCVVRHDRTIPIEITLQKMPVGGDAEFSCTPTVLPMPQHQAVIPNTPNTFTVTPADWAEATNVFACSIVFTPAEGLAPIYSRVYVALYAAKYVGLEQPTLIDNRVFLGQYARFAWVREKDGSEKMYEKTSISRVTKEPAEVVVISTQGRVAYAKF